MRVLLVWTAMCVGAVLIVAACIDHPVMGTVNDKQYVSSYMAQVPSETCYMVGDSYRNCYTTYVPAYHPAEWYLVVCNEDEGCVTVRVDEDVYHAASVGERYDSTQHDY